MKILIIEDNRILAKNIREYLTLKSFQAEIAFDGIMGKEKATSERFDVIILDINLPGKDGLTLCKELRDGGNNTPILFLTSRNTPKDVVTGLNSGADDYLGKPFDFEELIARLLSRLNRHLWGVFYQSLWHNKAVYPLYFVSMTKICPKCKVSHLRKNGIDRGVQKYRCMECGHMFRGKIRSCKSDVKNEELFHKYSVRKQTLAELSKDNKVSIRTIHRRLTIEFKKEIERNMKLRLNPNLSKYSSSVLILDATFFGKKGSLTQWGILVAQDGITGDILASKHIFQETLEDYRILLRTMKQEGYPKPHFAVIDGRNGVEGVIRDFYDIPVQICQSHKIATIDRYLLKHPRIESYRELKRIAHDMTRTDKVTFIWWLEKFKKQYIKDFEIRELDTKTLRYRYVHPRLLHAYKSLLRDIDRLFVSISFIDIIEKNINTSNRIECEFSHMKPKVKLHRGLSKKRRLSLALSLLWRDSKSE